MARERGTRNTEQLCRAPLIMVRVFVNKSHVLFQRSCQGEIVDYGVSLAFRADEPRNEYVVFEWRSIPRWQIRRENDVLG